MLTRISSLWRGADPRRRVALLMAGAVAAVILALLVRAATAPNMALLYSGLESSTANGVIEGLDRQGLHYEVRGDAIYVPASERDRARIRLAGEGLPAAGAAGYELLDDLSGFGTTAEMFDAAYWRAKEGELARTILASQHVVRARVHIAQSRRRPFEPPTPVTASITVTTSTGALNKAQAEAIRHLVASAVSGLSTHEVAVIDQERGVVLKAGDQEGEASLSDEALEQSERLREKVTRLLEARVGADAVIVEVAVETARSSETIRERILDPESKIAIHTETEESEDAASGAADAVTVASNLPDGDVEGGGDNSSRQTSRTRESTNYEVSETVRERVQPPGTIERITVAVMVDGVRTADAAGEGEWAPRSPEELEALRSLVQSAIGYSEERGDQVTIENLEFTRGAEVGTVAESGVSSALAAHSGILIQLAALAVAAALVGLFVLRPLLSAPDVPAVAALEDGGKVIEGKTSAPADDATSGFDQGADDGGGEMASLDDGSDDFGFAPAGDFGSATGMMLPMAIDGGDSLRSEVEAAIAAQPEKAIEILQEWLEPPTAETETKRAFA